MRVISGTARGTKLKTIENYNTRPTLDRIKETLFNMISVDICDSEFLDLFSGSGSIGIEALSRGAKKVVLVENNRECLGVIRENIDKTKLNENAVIKQKDVIDYLTETTDKFDIIFLDPPYSKGYNDKVLKIIDERKILKESGFIVVERDSSDEIDEKYNFNVYKEKKFKKMTFTFLNWNEG